MWLMWWHKNQTIWGINGAVHSSWTVNSGSSKFLRLSDHKFQLQGTFLMTWLPWEPGSPGFLGYNVTHHKTVCLIYLSCCSLNQKLIFFLSFFFTFAKKNHITTGRTDQQHDMDKSSMTLYKCIFDKSASETIFFIVSVVDYLICFIYQGYFNIYPVFFKSHFNYNMK